MSDNFSKIFKLEDFKAKTISNEVLDFVVKKVKETLTKNNSENHILNKDILSNEYLTYKSSKLKHIKNDYTVYLQYSTNHEKPVLLDVTVDVLFDKKKSCSGIVVTFDLMHDDVLDYIEDNFKFTLDDNFEDSEILCFEYFKEDELLQL